MGEGSVESMGSVSVREFTGSHTQTIYDNHSITGQGHFSGTGTFDGSITETSLTVQEIPYPTVRKHA